MYTLAFLTLAAACAFASASMWGEGGVWALLPLYATLSLGLLAVAYAGVGPRVLLKRDSGRRSPFAWPLFAPYFLLNTLAYSVARLVSREPAFARITPSLAFGRRLTAREAIGGGWVAVLDLAAEFPEAWPLRRLPSYRSMPVLDATAPKAAELREAVVWIDKMQARGPVYVHCAFGHGRSAYVVIAYLLAVGEVNTVADGERLLRSFRRGVRLNRAQRTLLSRFALQHDGICVNHDET